MITINIINVIYYFFLNRIKKKNSLTDKLLNLYKKNYFFIFF